MNKKSVLGLTLFACCVIAGLFLGAMVMTRQPAEINSDINNRQLYGNEAEKEDDSDNDIADNIDYIDQEQTLSDTTNYTDAENPALPETVNENLPADAGQEENQYEPSINLSDENTENSGEKTVQSDDTVSSDPDKTESDIIAGNEGDPDNEYASDETDEMEEALGENLVELPDMQLITDCTQVDYMKYIPEMIYDSRIEVALDIDNPSIKIKAKSAILFDVNTGKVLYYKNPIEPVFPASTAKLLTALVAFDWCKEEEVVTVGDEIDLIASDSTKASLKKGQILTVRNLIEGMLVPSGNDAAYVIAAYVGRKSLNNDNAALKDAIYEFVRLMNNKAKSLGVVNSCFKTPDGYDAIGQYTTAYDMGLIGLAAADNEVIVEVCKKSTARNVFADGYDVTWNSTNYLIKKGSPRYYPYCIGLKTGTSTMAGKCLISLAKNGDKEVLSVVMNSDSEGRWEDSRKLLDYGLSQ